MTVAKDVITRKARCNKLFQAEIPAARLTCLTSGSFRPKLGLFILTLLLVGGCVLLLVPILVPTPAGVSLRSLSKLSVMEITNKQAVQAVADANAKFTSKLYHQLAGTQQGNLVVSPFSIDSVLAMLMAGAKGSTAQQIQTAVAFPEDQHLVHQGFQELLTKLTSNENFTLDAANRLYVQQGFELLPSFSDLMAKFYHASPVETDFSNAEQACVLINTWVEQLTKGKIQDLIQKHLLNAMTRLVLVNAIYFKGPWQTKFDEAKTRKAPFHLLDGKQVEADMMLLTEQFKSTFVDSLHASALEMPYKGQRLSMIFFLPESHETFTEMEKNLAAFDLTQLKFPEFKSKMEVRIPRFKVESSHDLNDVLIAMGMKDMFDQGSADFSPMSTKGGLYVSKVLQKAFIEVNEQGSEAAAASAGIMMMRSAVMIPQFICNRPFVYMIRDNLTGMLLFAGRVLDPTH